MNEDLLGKCRTCDSQVSREAENCPNCRTVYPSLSEEEVQRYYSNCISCNERLLIRKYETQLELHPFFQTYDDNCPKCGQPKPIRFPPSPFSFREILLGLLKFVVYGVFGFFVGYLVGHIFPSPLGGTLWESIFYGCCSFWIVGFTLSLYPHVWKILILVVGAILILGFLLSIFFGSPLF